MKQKYKVFINHKEIILTTNLPINEKKICVANLKKSSLKFIIKKIKSDEINRLYLIGKKEKKLLENFKKKIPTVIAAGGLVINDKNHLLFIFRKNKWDLPKGKIELNETLTNGAKREVKEETGVKKISVQKEIDLTLHIFKRNKIYQLKQTHWFLMKSKFSGKLKPEISEGISKAEWKNKLETKNALKKTFPSIKYLFSKNQLIKTLFDME